MTVCCLTKGTPAASAKALANPQHGSGNAQQHFIPDEGLPNLQQLYSVPLTKP
jgi:hypothetical protein